MDERGGAIGGPAAIILHDFEMPLMDEHGAELELMDLGWSSEARSNLHFLQIALRDLSDRESGKGPAD